VRQAGRGVPVLRLSMNALPPVLQVLLPDLLRLPGRAGRGGRAGFPRRAAADGLDAEAGELGVVGAVVGLQVVAGGDGGVAAAAEDARQALSVDARLDP